jgi:hypothetical protein
MPKGFYLKWSTVPEWKKQVIDVIEEVAQENPTFMLSDVYRICNERFIHLPDGKKSVAIAFKLMVDQEFDYAKVLKRTIINNQHECICQSFLCSPRRRQNEIS